GISLLAKTNVPFRACNTDRYALVLLLFVPVVFLANSYSAIALNEALKFLSYIAFYFIGRVIPPRLTASALLGATSLVCTTLLVVSAVAGNGFIGWAAVSTFAGGYYFKTDLALATLIF